MRLSFLDLHLSFLDTYQIYHQLQPQQIRDKNILKFVVQDEQTIHHGVCFSPEKHCFFLQLIKENTSKEIEIRRFNLVITLREMIFHDFSSVKLT